MRGKQRTCPDCGKLYHGRFNRCVNCSQKTHDVSADDYEMMMDVEPYFQEAKVQNNKIDNWLYICEICPNDDCVRNDGEYQAVPSKARRDDTDRLAKCPIYFYGKQGLKHNEVYEILNVMA